MDFEIELKKKIAAEKDIIRNYDTGTQHKNGYDACKYCLELLNLISEQTPFEGFSGENYIERQPLVLNFEQLPEEKKKVFSGAMQDLFYFDLLIQGDLITIGKASNYKIKKSPAVISSRLAEELSTGKNVAISDRTRFERYRKEEKKLVDWILKDGQKKFPQFYVSSFKDEAVKKPVPSFKTESGNEPGQVNKIECIKHQSNTGKLKVIVNENYQSPPLEVTLGNYWTKFYELAEKQRVANSKGFFDYFNSNLKNPIYSKFKYKQSQILKFDGGLYHT